MNVLYLVAFVMLVSSCAARADRNYEPDNRQPAAYNSNSGYHESYRDYYNDGSMYHKEYRSRYTGDKWGKDEYKKNSYYNANDHDSYENFYARYSKSYNNRY